MKPLRIEFAEHVAAAQRAPWHALRREWRSASAPLRLAAAAALALCLAAGVAAVTLSRQYAAASAKLQSLAQRAPAQMQTPSAARHAPATLTPAQGAAVNEAIDQLNLPWRALLDAVEAATPPQIALLAVEADARRQIVRGHAEARDSDAMFAYLAALRAQPCFSAVQLSRHEANTQDPNRPQRFQFEAYWGGGAPLPGEPGPARISMDTPAEIKQ